MRLVSPYLPPSWRRSGKTTPRNPRMRGRRGAAISLFAFWIESEIIGIGRKVALSYRRPGNIRGRRGGLAMGVGGGGERSPTGARQRMKRLRYLGSERVGRL